MITHELLADQGILILRPYGALTASDFESLAAFVDPYLEKSGTLHGLMIEAESFPGWNDFAALVCHLKFVKAHHTRVEKIAAVTDGAFGTVAPKIASHFVKAEVRHFPSREREQALAWLSGKA
jgi:hypothetical protein